MDDLTKVVNNLALQISRLVEVQKRGVDLMEMIHKPKEECEKCNPGKVN